MMILSELTSFYGKSTISLELSDRINRADRFCLYVRPQSQPSSILIIGSNKKSRLTRGFSRCSCVLFLLLFQLIGLTATRWRFSTCCRHRRQSCSRWLIAAQKIRDNNREVGCLRQPKAPEASPNFFSLLDSTMHADQGELIRARVIWFTCHSPRYNWLCNLMR